MAARELRIDGLKTVDAGKLGLYFPPADDVLENELLEIWAQDRKTALFITHDLEEAIALSDRVIVMTASPGRVKDAYGIPLTRPREVTEVRFDPDFGPLYEAMWKDLKDEVRISYEKSRYLA